MSRTFVHRKIDWSEWYGQPYAYTLLYKCYNTRNTVLKRRARRIVRHSSIDEEGKVLTDSIAKSKSMSYLIRDKYW